MNTPKWISPLFVVAALYDGILGFAFLFAGGRLFAWLEVTPPNHLGYVQFPAALLIIFAIMFAAVAIDPPKSRNLILFGILLKISYCGVVLYHWLSADIPWIWKPFCIADFVFLALFALAWKVLAPQTSDSSPPASA